MTRRDQSRKLICAVLVACVALFPVADVQAGMVGAAAQRERIAAALSRPDVQARLEARGVDADDAKARIALLTDAEAMKLADDLDRAPAGGMVPIDALLYLAMFGAIILVGAIAAMVKKVNEHIARQ